MSVKQRLEKCTEHAPQVVQSENSGGSAPAQSLADMSTTTATSKDHMTCAQFLIPQ
ncbi:hypothetical protein PROFUN_16136 [Planoprotostelium fungivorum]|uniref:Uncharacterized protein n=1 Tax=Planoprotostelium fungivorum TaxID=1890364 RepID=A0A2P6MT33_9EUKA|nr:hypothetical protein PROFUN_16136 [Planoprotostelium fungivorum]